MTTIYLFRVLLSRVEQHCHNYVCNHHRYCQQHENQQHQHQSNIQYYITGVSLATDSRQ